MEYKELKIEQLEIDKNNDELKVIENKVPEEEFKTPNNVNEGH